MTFAVLEPYRWSGGQHREPFVRCVVDDPERQGECSGYRLSPLRALVCWCEWNYDANGYLSDECRCPDILAKETTP